MQPQFSVCFVGGPWNGRRRNISGSPHALASRVALPLPRNIGQPREQLAVYQLRNENGDWSYRHLQNASDEDLGVEPQPAVEWRTETWTAV